MKNKRGVAEGIDWILGLGIFILSITFIFILFKPGVKPLHDQETLLNIVQDGIEDEALWSITEVPIFISRLYDEPEGETVIFLDLDDGFNTTLREDGDGPTNNYGDQLDGILRDIGYSEMKLFYITRLIEGEEEDFSVFREGYTRREHIFDDEELDDEERESRGSGAYTAEAVEFCARDEEELRERDQQIFEELCEDEEDGRGRSRAGDERAARDRYVLYVNREREMEDEPYSDIERENELNFFINDVPIPEIPDDEIGTIVETGDFIMPAYLDSTKTKYVLTVASKPINFEVPANFASGIPIKACYAHSGEFQNSLEIPFPAGVDSTSDLPPDECVILYELGAKKNITGMHLPSLLALENFEDFEDSGCEKGYGCIKKEWDFPELREFMIEIETIPESSAGERCDDTQQLCYKFPENKPGPPLNINIFVRQFNSFLITDDGVKIPIIVRITIW